MKTTGITVWTRLLLKGKTANVGTVGINSPMGNSRNVAAEGGIVSVYYGGTLIGALIAGSLADRAGRIKAVVFGSMWALLGAILQASAQNIAWMCCGTHFSDSFPPIVSQLLGREPWFWSKPLLILLRLISLSRVTSLNQAMLTPAYPLARVIAGVGVGAIDCVIPVWSAEVSSHSARGAFLAIEFFMVTLLPSTSLVWLTRIRILVVSP